MAPRFLAFLLFGILAFAAFDGAELRRERRESATPSTSPAVGAPEVIAMDGGNPWPPPPKPY
jgi:hypothetical protein